MSSYGLGIACWNIYSDLSRNSRYSFVFGVSWFLSSTLASCSTYLVESFVSLLSTFPFVGVTSIYSLILMFSSKSGSASLSICS